MKATTKTPETPFNIAIAERRIDQIRDLNYGHAIKINEITQECIQKLLQIILRNVQINKKAEIKLDLEEHSFKIRYVYNKEKDYSHNIEFSFVRDYEVRRFNADNDVKVKEGDITKVSFGGFAANFVEEKCTKDDFDCLLLYAFIGKELRDDNSEFLSTLKTACAEIRTISREMETLWSEARELDGDISKKKTQDFEKQIRQANYFQEGNVIVVKKIKQDFVEASCMEITKVQKTTFYGKYIGVEITSVYHAKHQDSYAREIKDHNREKRHSIDTYTNIWASKLTDGNQIEVMTQAEWEKFKKEIAQEWEKIQSGKLTEKSKMYHEVKYRRD